MTTYHVLNESTLVYADPRQPGVLGVLAGKPQSGGHDWRDGPITATPSDTLRPATLADFDFYRVDPAGHVA
jgi:hypothetical protein